MKKKKIKNKIINVCGRQRSLSTDFPKMTNTSNAKAAATIRKKTTTARQQQSDKTLSKTTNIKQKHIKKIMCQLCETV